MSDLDVKKVEDRVNKFEDELTTFKKRFSEESMVDLLSQAMGKREHFQKLDQIKMIIIIVAICEFFQILLWLFMTEPV